MMRRQHQSEQLFYTFQLDRQVPADHILRRVDAILDLSAIRPGDRALFAPRPAGPRSTPS